GNVDHAKSCDEGGEAKYHRENRVYDARSKAGSKPHTDRTKWIQPQSFYSKSCCAACQRENSADGKVDISGRYHVSQAHGDQRKLCIIEQDRKSIWHMPPVVRA